MTFATSTGKDVNTRDQIDKVSVTAGKGSTGGYVETKSTTSATPSSDGTISQPRPLLGLVLRLQYLRPL